MMVEFDSSYRDTDKKGSIWELVENKTQARMHTWQDSDPRSQAHSSALGVVETD